MNRIVENLHAIGSAPSGGFCQGDHQGKVAKLLCGEGDQNQAGVAMVAPSGGVYGNPML